MSKGHQKIGRRRWQRLRRRTFDRDGWKCVRCGKRAKLECDHIIPMESGGESVLANLQTLCSGCHFDKTHGDFGRDIPGQSEWSRFIKQSRHRRKRAQI